MGSILSPLNYLSEWFFNTTQSRNIVCPTMSNYYRDSVFGSCFLIISPVPVMSDLSIEELCYVHDMNENDIVYELEFGSII
jgi:hypothetical protein